jgi:hypothetical protein
MVFASRVTRRTRLLPSASGKRELCTEGIAALPESTNSMLAPVVNFLILSRRTGCAGWPQVRIFCSLGL